MLAYKQIGIIENSLNRLNSFIISKEHGYRN